jgi:hypothetical protein
VTTLEAVDGNDIVSSLDQSFDSDAPDVSTSSSYRNPHGASGIR